MNRETPLLEVRHLRREFKETVAVQDVSFAVSPGTCFGLLGPNGAGKTTTIEIIEDILRPTAGTILYKGMERSEMFREEVGIQFQHTSLLDFLSVRETLTIFARLFSRPVDIEELIERCDLGPICTRRHNTLSGGQLQRLLLALALINDPTLIFLDEPSTGLDPQSRQNLWKIVRKVKMEGKTIILTTHSMEEAHQLCDTIAIMDRGLIIAEGSPEELIRTHCRTSTLKLPAAPLSDIHDPLPFTWQDHDGRAVIHTEDIDMTLQALTTRGIPLNELSVHNPTLEDVFLHLTGRTLRD